MNTPVIAETARPTAPGADAARIAWVDAARGMGILLVVVGHALGGIIDSPLGAAHPACRPVFMAIYVFHMPLFFMLSGLLVGRRMARDSGRFLRDLGRGLVWPYFLWSVIQFTIIYQLGNLVNRPPDAYWPTILALPWHTVSQFWFLYALLLLQLFAFASLRRLGATAVLLIGLSLKPLAVILPLPQVVEFACNQAPFYVLGAFLGVAGMEAMVVDRPRPIRAALLPLLAVGLIGYTVGVAQSFDASIPVDNAAAARLAKLSWNQLALPAALAGALAAVGLASTLRGRLLGAACLLGRKSMPIFLLHILVIAGWRIGAIHLLHMRAAGTILAVAIILGIVLPLLVDRVAGRLGIARLLGFA